jgi:hypothetical protein
MANMHLCTCKINLAGQGFTHVNILDTDPVSWPEAQVLIALHGDENVFDIKPIKVTDINHRMEKNRLYAKYGGIVEKVFPGRNPRMEMLMPGEPDSQPRIDQDGKAMEAFGNGNGHPNDEPQPSSPPKPPVPDDDDEDDDDVVVTAQGKEPPAGPAVFKHGKHPRPPVGV